MQKTCRAEYPNPRVVNDFTVQFDDKNVHKSKCLKCIQQHQISRKFLLMILDMRAVLTLFPP